jgi:selenocysteine-specific elongation factor
MPLESPNITLGTAGHIDHGKTCLVRFFTGCDTDRLKEEKERGMSIDLGFAPSTIGGRQVGIVDVPGHEGFVKTMVAGASGIEGCILVVAADDGVMPQTREHLDILSLLGVRQGVVALTKKDLVSADMLELAREEVAEFLADTFLAGAPIVPVNNLTGDGFPELAEALAVMVESIVPRSTEGAFRLPVERAFTVKGFGTVVAGVPMAGALREGDEVALLPQGQVGRVRRIEVYGRPSERALAGQCAAINVGQFEHGSIARGDTVAAPGYFEPSEWYACTLHLLPHEWARLKTGARVMLHTGTSEHVAAAYLLEADHMRAGESGVIQVHASSAFVAGPGDRFILRSLSPVRTIGGGILIEALPRRLKRTDPAVAPDLARRAEAVRDPRAFLEYCICDAGPDGASQAALARRTKQTLPQLRRHLDALLATGAVMEFGADLYAHRAAAEALASAMLGALERYHEQSPASPGMTPDGLQQASGVPARPFGALVAMLRARQAVIEAQGRLALPGHGSTLTPDEQRLLDAVAGVFEQGGAHPPAVAEVAAAIGRPEARVDWAVEALCQRQELVRVAPGILFHRSVVDQARERLVAHIRSAGRLESVDFKYLLDTSRKYAIPLLDYFDRIGLTRRVGYTRYLRGS